MSLFFVNSEWQYKCIRLFNNVNESSAFRPIDVDLSFIIKRST